MSLEEIERRFGVAAAEAERMSQDAERGILHGRPRGDVIRGQGRPRLSDEDLVPITFKVPLSKRAAVDAMAASRGESRSDLMRDILDAALT